MLRQKEEVEEVGVFRVRRKQVCLLKEKKAVNSKIRRQQPRKLKAHMQGKTNNASVSSLGIKNTLSEVTGLLKGNYSL